MKNLILFLTAFSSSSFLWAHGEDKYGPHKGFIRMPGAFHTEVVLDSSQAVKVYLLDMEWKNPVTEKSRVQVSYVGSRNISESARCVTKKNFFLCSFPRKVNLKTKGVLKIQATRVDQSGQEAVYDLPLKLAASEPKPPATDHNNHH